MKRILFAMALACAVPAAAEPVLIQDGRVVTGTGIIEGGDVLFDGARIVAVGEALAAPANARVFDASGKWVTPGAFAGMSQLGLSEILGSGAPNDSSASGDLASAALDVAAAFNPSNTAIGMTRADGVTRFAIGPTRAGTLFVGRGALASSSGSADSLYRARAFMLVELGETGAARMGGSRAALWPAFEAALTDAREYPGRYRSGQGGAVLNELDAAALAPFARGQGLLLVHVENETDIRRLIAFKRANSTLRIAIYGGAEAWMAAEELASANIPVVLNPLSNLPESFERLGARLDNAALLDSAGVTVAFAPGPGGIDAYEPGLVLQLAGNAVANGMEWRSAFAAVSSGPARIFGAGGELGALARGYIADVVIWDGDPLEVTSAPVAVFIAGEEQSLTNRQTRLRDRYNPLGR